MKERIKERVKGTKSQAQGHCNFDFYGVLWQALASVIFNCF